MSRILGIELRRSAAFGAALLIAVAGSIVLQATSGRWSSGWMALVMVQREYLIVVVPLTMAAGAWQSYREHRANVAELFATVPRPRPLQVVPVLIATGLAALVAYLVALAAAVPRIIDTASYLPAAAFVVVAVGVLTMVVAFWLGLGLGRLRPALATAPAVAVAGFALLGFGPQLFSDEAPATAFFPGSGMGTFSAYDTISGRISATQTVWLVALAAAAFVLFAVRHRRFAVAALVPLVVGATLTAFAMPTDDAYDREKLDPVAQQLVCTEDAGPRVCVSRANESLLPEVTPKARHVLKLLASTPIVEAHEDTSTFFPMTKPAERPDTVLMNVQVDRHGHLAFPGRLELQMLTGVFGGPVRCGDSRSYTAGTVAAFWLLGREPATGLDGMEFEDPESVQLYRDLRALPKAEADARVAAVYPAAEKCRDTLPILTGGAR
ncbi:ABC transporter permease [Cryptosporangium arvum]|uniref:ABC-type transport system involved in multi-copper enzyme maturation, permease component n=1 Tax=Cryptosporangium arvum DSM 44712 TaxID=927661 RepID=A0A010ZTV7_9ACTN|nr:ABC transporter permease [Cryptosporangium arvum]EXG80647.1 hypothetical protein CryarDRAFT_1731 [Cryptosporangium arvum DSM 44712]